VISIMAVMIIGAGLDRTGVMHRVAAFILRVGGSTERRIIPTVAGTVGMISSFMQNVGAAALFMPVMSRISTQIGIPLSRLLMPMGFAAIVGGTITMVGSSPLILLNDLLPPGMEPFGLFDVSPIGMALLLSTILYFVLLGRYVLPGAGELANAGEVTLDYFRRVYGLDFEIREVKVGAGNACIGRTVGELEALHDIMVVASANHGDLRVGPWYGLCIESGMSLAILGKPEQLENFIQTTQVRPRREWKVFEHTLAPGKSGIAEVVIAPDSQLIGKTIREIAMRRTYGLSVLRLQRGQQALREGLREIPLHPTDTLVVHCDWEALAQLEKNRDFVVVTSDYPKEVLLPKKVPHALFFLGVALGLILLTDLPLAMALMTGALGMVLVGVLSMEEAYQAISWKTVFLLASLIPLGMAVENTGTAAWIAQGTLQVLGDVPPWVLQTAIFILATLFTLVMSNVGATVLLVPLSINLALAAQVAGMPADPRIFALTVAIATSNAFLIPTHQVNALIMGPAGYRVRDFLKAGSLMTLLFMTVALIMLNVVF